MWLPMPQLPMLSTLPQLWLTPSMPQLSTLQVPTPSTPPQLLSRPQLTMPQPQLTRLRLTLMRSPPTPTPTPLLMTTPSPTSTLRNNLMVPAMLPDLTLLLFPMDVSNMSSPPPMVMMDVADVTYEGTAVYP